MHKKVKANARCEPLKNQQRQTNSYDKRKKRGKKSRQNYKVTLREIEMRECSSDIRKTSPIVEERN